MFCIANDWYKSSFYLGHNNFGRRMSLATLGNGKYGRADDRTGAVVVRHIPIIIEGQEDQVGNI